MANVKDRYTQTVRDARAGRMVSTREATRESGRTVAGSALDVELSEERRLADTFRRRARDDYAPTTRRA